MTAVSLLAEAKAAGVTLRLVAGNPKVGGSPSPDLLARLRQHKPELVALLRGDACRYCGGAIDWTVPGARAFADELAAHNTCWEEAEIDRHFRHAELAVDPRFASDPNETVFGPEAGA